MNSTKLRNGGQVYIKDGPTKPPLATITNVKQEAPPLTPTFTITATPKLQQVAPQTMNVTPTVGSDFLSSIIQAVGIQSSDENNDMGVHQQQSVMPQYTLTIDGQTLKASPVQYKLTETTPTFNFQQTNMEDNFSGNISVDEFLKLKTTPKTTQRKQQTLQPMTIEFAGSSSDKKQPKIELIKQQNAMQKPKINFVLSTPTKQQQQQQKQTVQNTPNKTVSLQQLFQQATTSNKGGQTMVPLVVKSDGSIEASNQLLSQIVAANEVTPTKQQQQYTTPPVAYVQLKVSFGSSENSWSY